MFAGPPHLPPPHPLPPAHVAAILGALHALGALSQFSQHNFQAPAHAVPPGFPLPHQAAPYSPQTNSDVVDRFISMLRGRPGVQPGPIEDLPPTQVPYQAAQTAPLQPGRFSL